MSLSLVAQRLRPLIKTLSLGQTCHHQLQNRCLSSVGRNLLHTLVLAEPLTPETYCGDDTSDTGTTASDSINESTLRAIRAAQGLQTASAYEKDATKGVWVLVAGKSNDVTEDNTFGRVHQLSRSICNVPGVDKVLLADADAFRGFPLPETVSSLVTSLHSSSAGPFGHIIAPGTPWGRAVLPRIAALMGGTALNNVSRVIDSATFQRPIYAGAVIATVKVSDTNNPICFTVADNAFSLSEDESMQRETPAAALEVLPSPSCSLTSSRISTVIECDISPKGLRPSLTSAQVVVSGGRGVQNKEGFKKLELLADKLGDGAVGATRVLVDSDIAPHDIQIGQTGKTVSPRLYVAVGLSGAIQHLAGMQSSRIVVAINNDPQAPIFQASNYGLVDDWDKVVSELISKL